MAYVYMNLNPLSKHTGDSTIRAIAYATNQRWSDVYIELCSRGFQKNEMPSSDNIWGDYLKELGYTRHVIDSCCTVEDFCREHSDGKFILYIPCSNERTGYVVAVNRGNIYDTWNCLQEIPLVYWEKE